MPAPDPLSAAKFNATREVRKIYADLAARPLERSCALRTDCCHFKLTGKTPHLTYAAVSYTHLTLPTIYSV